MNYEPGTEPFNKIHERKIVARRHRWFVHRSEN